MKNILIIGASGSLAQTVINQIQDYKELNITLYLRDPKKLRNIQTSRFNIIQGDVMDKAKLTEAIKEKEVVYVNLAGNLGAMTRNIVEAMKEKDPKGHLIFISSIGIYDNPVSSNLRPYREGADMVENSGLDYTILRPSWFTNDDEINYELRSKGKSENTGTISRKSLATVISRIIRHPQMHRNQNLNVSRAA